MRDRAGWAATGGIAAVLLLSLVMAFQIDVGGLYTGREVLVGRAFVWVLVTHAAWMITIPMLAWSVRRWPFGESRALPVLSGHLAASAVVAGVHAALAVVLAVPIGPFPGLTWSELGPAWTAYLAVSVHVELLLYWGTLGAVAAADASRRAQDRTRRAAELEVQVADARLAALQARIQPHFLFNTLNAVSMLVRGGRQGEAVTTLSDLGDLLRAALRDPLTSETSLAAEVELVEQYLRIERQRFPDRLSWEVAVDPDVGEVNVPPLILQPLVENAVRHGVAATDAPVHVAVHAERLGEPDRFVLSVTDDGPGIFADGSSGEGLRNTRERLRAFYGAGDLQLRRVNTHTISEVSVPWTSAADA